MISIPTIVVVSIIGMKGNIESIRGTTVMVVLESATNNGKRNASKRALFS